MKDCIVCGGSKSVRGMGYMKENCKACNGTGIDVKAAPVVVVKKARKKKEKASG